MFEDCVLLLYSHSKYHEVLYVCLSRLIKHFVPMKIALCIDNATKVKEQFGEKINFFYIYEYKDIGPFFYARLSPLLDLIQEPYILFNMDNNILIDDVKLDQLVEHYQTMKETKIDHFHLMCGGTYRPAIREGTHFDVTSEYRMSVLTAFWKRTSFLKLSQQFEDHTFRCCECSPIQEFMASQFRCCCLYPNDQKSQCPGDPTFADTFPVIHAVTKGKWAIPPSQKHHIEQMAAEYSIDVNGLGTVV